jgi:hypothetical protein
LLEDAFDTVGDEGKRRFSFGNLLWNIVGKYKMLRSIGVSTNPFTLSPRSYVRLPITIAPVVLMDSSITSASPVVTLPEGGKN